MISTNSRTSKRYKNLIQSRALDSEEYQAIQPSTISSWCLRSGMYPTSLSRLVEGETASMDLGTRVPTEKLAAREAPRDMNAHRMSVSKWVADQRRIWSQRPAPEVPSPTMQCAVSPVARVGDVFRTAGTLSRPPRPLGLLFRLQSVEDFVQTILIHHNLDMISQGPPLSVAAFVAVSNDHLHVSTEHSRM